VWAGVGQTRCCNFVQGRQQTSLKHHVPVAARAFMRVFGRVQRVCREGLL